MARMPNHENRPSMKGRSRRRGNQASTVPAAARPCTLNERPLPKERQLKVGSF